MLLTPSVFDALNMTQYMRSPTHDNNLLDVLACSDDRKFIHDVTVDDADRVSDHRLVKAMFAVGMKRWTPISYQFQPLNAMNFSEFERSILSSSLFTATADKLISALTNCATS